MTAKRLVSTESPSGSLLAAERSHQAPGIETIPRQFQARNAGSSARPKEPPREQSAISSKRRFGGGSTRDAYSGKYLRAGR
jgi:hypothetical protein